MALGSAPGLHATGITLVTMRPVILQEMTDTENNNQDAISLSVKLVTITKNICFFNLFTEPSDC